MSTQHCNYIRSKTNDKCGVSASLTVGLRKQGQRFEWPYCSHHATIVFFNLKKLESRGGCEEVSTKRIFA